MLHHMGCASSSSAHAPSADHDLLTCAQQPDGAHAQAMLDESGAFLSLEDVQKALQRRGVTSTRMVFALDLTKANKSAGAQSFHGKQQVLVDSTAIEHSPVCPGLASSYRQMVVSIVIAF